MQYNIMMFNHPLIVGEDQPGNSGKTPVRHLLKVLKVISRDITKKLPRFKTGFWPFQPHLEYLYNIIGDAIYYRIDNRINKNHPTNKYLHMAVSKNNGTSKSSILIGFPIINHPFRGTPIFGNTHIIPSWFPKNTLGPAHRFTVEIMKVTFFRSLGK